MNPIINVLDYKNFTPRACTLSLTPGILLGCWKAFESSDYGWYWFILLVICLPGYALFAMDWLYNNNKHREYK